MDNITLTETASGKVPYKYCIYVGGLTNGYQHDLDETLRRVAHLIEHGADPARIVIRSEQVTYHDFSVKV